MITPVSSRPQHVCKPSGKARMSEILITQGDRIAPKPPMRNFGQDYPQIGLAIPCRLLFMPLFVNFTNFEYLFAKSS